MKLYIISGALPPQLDGIGDYTALLAAELAKSAEVVVLTGAANPAPICCVDVESIFSANDPKTITAVLARVISDPPDWVLLQYNPFSYGRWGMNLQLPGVMRAIKRSCPETRIGLMVHEAFVPIDSVKFAVMTTWQRWQLWQLGRCADKVLFSIEPWAKKFQRWFPKQRVDSLAVGSNIPLVSTNREAIRAELGISKDTVVLGYFGTTHVSRLLSWVRAAAEAILESGRQVLVLYVGPDRNVMNEVLAGVPHLTTGSLPANEVSRRFSAMDIHLSTFTDGISTRRGSFMTGIQHGIPTVATYGDSTGSDLIAQNGKAFLLTDAHSPDQFQKLVCSLAADPHKRETIGYEAKRFYAQNFAWERIAMELFRLFAETDYKIESANSIVRSNDRNLENS